MASVRAPPRQLAPTVGLIAALAGLISDGTFFIDSGEHLAWRLRGFRSPGRFRKLFVTGANIVNEFQGRHGWLAAPLACSAALHQHCRRALACRCGQRLALTQPTDIIGRSRMRKVTRGLNFGTVPVC